MLTKDHRDLVKEIQSKRAKAKRIYLLQRFLCFFNFHTPYYKYGPYRNITYNTNPPSYSNGPEHLGYHCRVCEIPLGAYRNKRYWFK